MSRRKYDFISLLISVVFVVLCILCITPDETISLKKQTNVPYISAVKGNPCIEQSFSAGVFLPTIHNVHCRASMPTLECAMEVLEVRSINVFNGREKSSIVSAIDLLQNTMPYNILSDINISEVRALADMDLNVATNGIFCENIMTGDRCNLNGQNIDGESNILLCKIGDMVFSSPGEFSQILPVKGNFLDDGLGGTKFLRLKPFR
ncbi:MAG: hypothetical protein LBI47_02340 [Puniceicoccales bacterium]|jgi:hypothetical protein|nr:hypothetical protein [Puniceicoccales bacterium]